jgi:hypothetical protein
MIDLGFSLACTHQEFYKASSSEIFNIGIFVENIFSWLSSFFKSFTDQSSIQPIEKPINFLKTPLLPDSSDQSSIPPIEKPKNDPLQIPSEFSLDTTDIDCTDESQLLKDSKRNSYLIDGKPIDPETDQSSIPPIEKPKNNSLKTPPNFSLDSTKIDCTEDQLKKDSERNFYLIDGILIDPENVHSTLLALMEEVFKNVKDKFLGSVTQGIMLDGCLAASNYFFPKGYMVTQAVGDKPEFSINTQERTVTITNHFSLLSTQDNKPYRYKLQCKTLVDFKTDNPSGKISFNFIGEAGISLG